jgi:predicted acylesterase/phospholipase RssA
MTVLTPWRRGRRPVVAPDPVRPREVVVLSGGGSLGAAQVGALQALIEAGIVPDAVIGCSVGSINAVYVATLPTIERLTALEAVWRSMSRRAVFPDGRVAIARRLMSRDNHLYTPAGLRALLADSLTIDDLSQTAVPCHVVTTDLLSGEPVWWTSGDPLEVLSASACIPGLFPPVKLGGRLHVDGGVSCPVPTQRALDLGAARVWVLNVSREFHGWADDRMSALDVLLESFAISRSHLGRQQPVPGMGQRIVALPALSLGRHDMRDFSRTSWLIRAGREAGRAMVRAERQPRPRLLSSPKAQ